MATSFSGADTFGSHLRWYGHPYVLVAASETQDYHRAAHEANHPGLEVFARCVSEPSVTCDIPAHHLRFCGFPCVSYSRLNRRVDDMILSSSLVLFEAFLASVRFQPPPVILLENVTSLLGSGLRWVLGQIEAGLRGLENGGYLIFRDVLCCSDLGAACTRPRVFWVLYRR